jgi:predicted metal-binding membrane protein
MVTASTCSNQYVIPIPRHIVVAAEFGVVNTLGRGRSLGCCWALRALLFVAGLINLLWVVAIAAAEKKSGAPNLLD